MRIKILVFIALIWALATQADQAPYHMHEFILESDLIVKAKITAHTDHYFRIKVEDVFNDKQYGIQKGDYLKINEEFHTSVSMYIGHAENKETGIFFLGKSNRGWGLKHGVVAFIKNNQAKVEFSEEGCALTLPPNEWKRQLKVYFQEFEPLPKGKIKGKRDEESFYQSSLPALVSLQYIQIYSILRNVPKYRNLCEAEMIELPLSKIRFIPNPFLEQEKPPQMLQELETYIHLQLKDLKLPPIKGRTFFSFRYNAKGVVQKVVILRPIHEEVDKAIHQFFEQNQQWKLKIDLREGNELNASTLSIYTNSTP